MQQSAPPLFRVPNLQQSTDAVYFQTLLMLRVDRSLIDTNPWCFVVWRQSRGHAISLFRKGCSFGTYDGSLEISAGMTSIPPLRNSSNSFQAELKAVNDKVEALEAQCAETVAEKQRLADEAETTANRLVRAEKLTSGLASEGVRWLESLESLGKQKVNTFHASFSCTRLYSDTDIRSLLYKVASYRRGLASINRN